MHLQMRYVMPVIVAIIAYTLSALIGLYWTTTNLFTIGQELYVRKRWKQKEEKSDNKSH
jgi:membrane protein insertase Oxa1/YidC/SpoIIIJ